MPEDTQNVNLSQDAPKPKKRRRTLPERVCPCGEKYTPTTTWQRFHTPACRTANWDNKNRRVNPNKAESVAYLIKMVQEAEPDSPLFRAMQRAVYSKTQRGKRKTK